MWLHSWFHLIWYATWPCFEKVNFDIWPHPRVCLWLEGSGGKIFATTFMHLWFNLICNLTMFLKSLILTFWPQGMGVSGALPAKYLLPWCCIHDSLKFVMFWKSWILTFWPHLLSPPRELGTRLWSKITFDMFLIYCNAVCMRNFCKNIDVWLSFCEIYILDLWPHRGGGGGVHF